MRKISAIVFLLCGSFFFTQAVVAQQTHAIANYNFKGGGQAHQLISIKQSHAAKCNKRQQIVLTKSYWLQIVPATYTIILDTIELTTSNQPSTIRNQARKAPYREQLIHRRQSAHEWQFVDKATTQKKAAACYNTNQPAIMLQQVRKTYAPEKIKIANKLKNGIAWLKTNQKSTSLINKTHLVYEKQVEQTPSHIRILPHHKGQRPPPNAILISAGCWLPWQAVPLNCS